MTPMTPSRWEMKLAVPQVIALSLVFIAGLSITFYLGFSAGRTTGHEQALAASLAAAPKVSLKSVRRSSEGDEGASTEEIYAKLNRSLEQEIKESDSNPGIPEKKPGIKADQELPEVASIPVTEMPDADSEDKERVLASVALDQEPLHSKGSLKGKTLGELEPQNQKLEAEPELPPTQKIVAHDSEALKMTDLEPLSAVKADSEIAARVQKVEVSTKPTPLPTSIQPTKVATKPEKVKSQAEPAKLVEEKKAVITPKAEATTSQAGLKRGWFAQVAAPEAITDAQGLVASLRRNGFRASIENATVRGQSYYRVLVGPEEDKNQAEVLVQQLQRESYLRGAPFLRYVK